MMDYVLPFVDCGDPVWLSEYLRINGKGMDVSRFRPFDTLRYAFRSIAENMPFIDRIVLIVSNIEQVPEWVNRETVHIVLHSEFMPGSHLPTFNSSAIESDMWRIEGLTDRFIYGNDDIFVLNPLNEADFFDGDRPRLTFAESDYHIRNLFRRCCRKGMDMAADAAGVDRTDPYILLKPQHCMKGIRTASMKEVGQRCAAQIDESITVLRHWNNVTGYLYQYYEYYTGNYAPFDVDCEYIRITNDYDAVLDHITDRKSDVLCINDAGDLNEERYRDACEALKESFEGLFPNRCRYELF